MSDEEKKKQLVQDAMDAILVDHDKERVRGMFHPDFVQHNPWADDGGEHVVAMCEFPFGVEMRRWAVQGDIVAYHGLYTAPNPLGDEPLLCVDMWRIQGEQIVEHWDVLKPVPQEVAEACLAGEGDGMAAVSPAQSASYAAAARRLLEVGVNGRNFAVIESHLSSAFQVHGPDVKPGTSKERFGLWVKNAEPTVEVKRSVASGDLVFLQLLVKTKAGEQVVYDIFRFDGDGKITDQWMVSQDRVSMADAANPHPHF